MEYNDYVILFKSVARNLAQPYIAEYESPYIKSAHIIIDSTLIPALAPSVTPYIQGYDQTSGKWYDILIGLPIVAVSVRILKVHPNIENVNGVSVNDILPRKWRLLMDHADTNSITYSVGANLRS